MQFLKRAVSRIWNNKTTEPAPASSEPPPPKFSIDDLFAAAERGDKNWIASLIQQGIDPNTRRSDGVTALILAVREKRLEAIDALLKGGADPNLPSSEGWYAYHFAKNSKQTEVAARLLAAHNGVEPVAPASSEPPPPKFSIDDLFAAAERGDKNWIASLIQQGIDPNTRRSDGVTALILAVREKRLEAIDALLKGGADPNLPSSEGWYAYHFAKNSKQTEVAARLLAAHNGVEPVAPASSEPPPPKFSIDDLFAAAERGDKNWIASLIQQGIDPNTRRSDGVTALILAVREKRLEAIDALLKGGADPNLPSSEGWYAYHFAKNSKQTEVAARLLAAHNGVEPVAPASSEPPPPKFSIDDLFAAAERGDKNWIASLIQQGIDPNTRRSDGVTALILAVREKRLEAIDALLKGGADPNLPSSEGWYAYHFAKNSNQTEVAARLLAAHNGVEPVRSSKTTSESA